MTTKQFINALHSFFFKPESATPIAFFRIAFGILLFQSAVLHVGENALDWYGPNGVVTLATIKQYWWWNYPHFDMFMLFPQTELGTLAVWGLYVVALFTFTIGLFTRWSSVVVLLGLISMHNHQPFNINGGDSMLRQFAVCMVFIDSGAALSVDRLIDRYIYPSLGAESRRNIIPCGLKMLQLQMALAYGATFIFKMCGYQWWDGTAVYYATRLQDLMRYPVPFDHPIMWKVMTWFTLLIEGAMCSLVWLKDLRYWCLLGIAALHLGIDHCINLPVFEWAFIAGLIPFIYPQDLSKSMDWIKGQLNLRLGAPATLIFDPANSRQLSFASVIEGLDVFGRLNIVGQNGAAQMTALTGTSALSGSRLFVWLTARLPLLWPVYLLCGLPEQIIKSVQRRGALST